MSLKFTLRDSFARVLNLIPGPILTPIRGAYAGAVPNSFRSTLLSSVLAVLRYRHIDRNLETFTLSDDSDIKFTSDNSFITRQIYWYGSMGYEKPVLDLWKDLSGRASHILEIGGNIGYFTIHGARAGHSAVYTVVEPHPVSAELLHHNVQLNRLSNVVIVRAAAVGHKQDEVMDLAVPRMDPDSTPAGAHLLRTSERSMSVREVVQVPVVEVAKLFESVDLLKIDAEGSEFDILSAIVPQIRKNRPLIVMELLPDTPRLRELIVGLLNEKAYRAFAIGKDGLHPLEADEIQRVDLGKTYGTRDIVLLSGTDAILKRYGSRATGGPSP